MKYSRSPCVYIDIGGSSVRAIQKSASERRIQLLDPTACSLDPFRNTGYEQSRSWTRKSNCIQKSVPRRRACQEDRLIQHSRSNSIPRSIVSNVNAFDMSPFIRGFQDNMSNWMSSLVHQQDGCLQMVAQRASQGRVQEQLAHTVAQKQRCHHRMIKYQIYVRNSHIEKHN